MMMFLTILDDIYDQYNTSLSTAQASISSWCSGSAAVFQQASDIFAHATHKVRESIILEEIPYALFLACVSGTLYLLIHQIKAFILHAIQQRSLAASTVALPEEIQENSLLMDALCTEFLSLVSPTALQEKNEVLFDIVQIKKEMHQLEKRVEEGEEALAQCQQKLAQSQQSLNASRQKYELAMEKLKEQLVQHAHPQAFEQS
jgi:hypothetical protein